MPLHWHLDNLLTRWSVTYTLDFIQTLLIEKALLVCASLHVLVNQNYWTKYISGSDNCHLNATISTHQCLLSNPLGARRVSKSTTGPCQQETGTFWMRNNKISQHVLVSVDICTCCTDMVSFIDFHQSLWWAFKAHLSIAAAKLKKSLVRQMLGPLLFGLPLRLSCSEQNQHQHHWAEASYLLLLFSGWEELLDRRKGNEGLVLMSPRPDKYSAPNILCKFNDSTKRGQRQKNPRGTTAFLYTNWGFPIHFRTQTRASCSCRLESLVAFWLSRY